MALNLVSTLTLTYLLFPRRPLDTGQHAAGVQHTVCLGCWQLSLMVSRSCSILWIFRYSTGSLGWRADRPGFLIGLEHRQTAVRLALSDLCFAILLPRPIMAAAAIVCIQCGWLADPILSLSAQLLSEWISNLSNTGFTGQNRGIMALLGLCYPGAFPASIGNIAFQAAALVLLPTAVLLFYLGGSQKSRILPC